jgi:hypothetical protein
MKILLTSLEANKARRPSGYYEDVLAHGKVEGEFLVINPDNYTALVVKYQPMRGAGDLVAIPAQAIARTIDKVFHTNIADCSGCQQRRDALNKLIPFK